MARVIGIDVSKLRLDVYRLEDGRAWRSATMLPASLRSPTSSA
jgi:hypothetical protein